MLKMFSMEKCNQEFWQISKGSGRCCIRYSCLPWDCLFMRLHLPLHILWTSGAGQSFDELLVVKKQELFVRFCKVQQVSGRKEKTVLLIDGCPHSLEGAWPWSMRKQYFITEQVLRIKRDNIQETSEGLRPRRSDEICLVKTSERKPRNAKPRSLGPRCLLSPELELHRHGFPLMAKIQKWSDLCVQNKSKTIWDQLTPYNLTRAEWTPSSFQYLGLRFSKLQFLVMDILLSPWSAGMWGAAEMLLSEWHQLSTLTGIDALRLPSFLAGRPSWIWRIGWATELLPPFVAGFIMEWFGEEIIGTSFFCL